MEALFLHILNMAIGATPLMLGVLLARRLMKPAPKWVVCLLWAAVALRLICPFSLESPMGLMPSQPPVTQELVNEALPMVAVPEILMPEGEAAPAGTEVQPKQPGVMETISAVWALGVAGMLLYLLGSCLGLEYKVRESMPLGQRVWLCDGVETPFILGVVLPRIYLPSGIRREDLPFVIAHERAHLRRKDHWWKPLGFLVLAVYWFHPLAWAAYVLMCRDLELACDERVIRNFTMAQRKAYSSALLECSCPKKRVFACPVAFGEVAVKDRVVNILHYKKPGFWIILLCLAAIAVGTVCFMTAPSPQEVPLPEPAVTIPEPQAVPEPTVLPTEEPQVQPEEVLSGEWAEYPDGIRIEHISGETYNAHVMLIRDPAWVTMGTSAEEFSEDIPGKRLTQVMEENPDVIAAINAGAAFDDGTASEKVGSTPLGLVMSGGECVWEEGVQPGIQGFAGFNEDHVLVVAQKNPTEEEAKQWKIRDGCCFGPVLLMAGEVNQQVLNRTDGSYEGYAPRTAIGQRSDGAVIFVCIDGRQVDSLGGDFEDLVRILQEYGAVNACNMDGGSYTVMMHRDPQGQVSMVNRYSLAQSEPRRMPNYWLVRP